MGTAFDDFLDAQQKFMERVREASESINTNRQKYAGCLKRFEEAVLADTPTTELEKELAGINAEFEIINHRANALNKASGKKGSNGFVKNAALRVVEENTAAMAELQQKWDAQKIELNKALQKYYRVLVGMGKIYRTGQQLQEQVNLSSGSTGQNAFLPNVGGELNLAHRKGFIFPDPKTIADAFVNGALPADPESQNG